jgi:hypothetical protein
MKPEKKERIIGSRILADDPCVQALQDKRGKASNRLEIQSGIGYLFS